MISPDNTNHCFRYSRALPPTHKSIALDIPEHCSSYIKAFPQII